MPLYISIRIKVERKNTENLKNGCFKRSGEQVMWLAAREKKNRWCTAKEKEKMGLGLFFG